MLYAIFGRPLSHTLSPAMQNAAFKALGLAAFYIPLEATGREFGEVLRRRRRLILEGFNVTVPYKELAALNLDGVDRHARLIGAVNTVKRMGRRWIGFNTDWSGWARAIESDLGFRLAGKRVLLLGAGGSARACLYALGRRGARSVTLVNRSAARRRALERRVRRLFPRLEIEGGRLGAGLWKRLRSERFDLVVNATPVGLQAGDGALVPPSFFRGRRLLVYDFIYRPRRTKLLRAAEQAGQRAANGLGMLLYQGAEAFELWTGRRAPLGVMRRALARALQNKEAALFA